MAKWIGYAVSVNCGDPLGCYQGTILEADGNTITLTKAFRNGFPYPKAQVTLNAADIKDLRIIETRAEPAEQTHSTVAVSKNNKKNQKATVCENLQANPTNSGNQANVSASNACKSQSTRGPGPGTTPARSKPIDIQATRSNKANSNNAGSYGNAGSTPKARGAALGGHDKARRRNEACFGDEAEPALDDDFDFEGNLALFDKRALWERMRNSKPDLVRQADEAGKLRHDENVLGDGGRAAGCLRGIRVPDELRGAFDYVTDEGVVVPAASGALRRRLWDALERLGAGAAGGGGGGGVAAAARTLLARGAADVCLRLVGGGRRLDPRNAHQTPAVVLLAAPHRLAAAGLCCLRLLASHGARVALHLTGESSCAEVEAELAALALSGVRPTALERLPSADLVLLALPEGGAGAGGAGEAAALAWARRARAACVALEPPAGGWGALRCRASVVALLPAALAPSLGRVYLADAAPPPQLFRDLRLQYRPPFGAQAVLALHVADANDLPDEPDAPLDALH